MNRELRYRLADSTVVEPLVNQWSAWAQLISPVPASLHLLNFQLPALTSYLEDPAAHARASRDPDLIGGPFVDLPPQKAGGVRELLRLTEETQGEKLGLARSLTSFQNRLVEEASGQPLAPFYGLVPDELRGRVELVYDYYNRPAVRCFENLFYRSRFYDEGLQSLRLWQLRRDDARAFFMSTPRLPEDDQLDWRVPFADPRVDELFKLDAEPQSLERVGEILGLGATGAPLLGPLLSSQPRALPEVWDQETPRVRYFGHACVLIEWKGVSVLTDPFVGAVPTEGGMPRFSYGDLPARIDCALVTHNHQDHFALETLLRLRHRIDTLVVPKCAGLLYGDMSLKLMTRRLGFKNVVELDAFETIELADGQIVAVPFLGEHGDLAHSKSAYVVRAGGEQMLVGADSDCLDRQLYAHIRAELGPVGTVFLGTESVGAPLSWGAGPLFPRKPQHQHEQTRRYHGSDARRALEILQTLDAERIFVYALGIEPWVEHLLGLGLTEDSPQFLESERLIAAARGRGLRVAERFSGTAVRLIGGEAPAAKPLSARAASDTPDADDQFSF
jgi:L-ascorbate metabolism protein UlaG (beta-lactamase superfamily)